MLPDLDSRLYGLQISACTSFNFLLMGDMLFCYLTVLVDLLIMHVIQSFLRSRLMAEVSKIDLRAELMAKSSTEILKVRADSVSILFMFCANLDLFAFAILSLSLVLCSKSFKLTNTLVGLYLVLCRLMPLTRAVVLITLTLLAYSRQ